MGGGYDAIVVTTAFSSFRANRSPVSADKLLKRLIGSSPKRDCSTEGVKPHGRVSE